MTQSSFATRSQQQLVHPPLADRLRPLGAAARRSATQVTFCVRGVISPILANLFLHYAFDLWMKRTHPDLPWCRYADDGLVHCRTEQEAEALKTELQARLAECQLQMHPTMSPPPVLEGELAIFDRIG